MSFTVIHIFSSNYESRNFEALAGEVEKIAKSKECQAETVDVNGLKFQKIYPRTPRQLKGISSSLRINNINHALLTPR